MAAAGEYRRVKAEGTKRRRDAAVETRGFGRTFTPKDPDPDGLVGEGHPKQGVGDPASDHFHLHPLVGDIFRGRHDSPNNRPELGFVGFWAGRRVHQLAVVVRLR